MKKSVIIAIISLIVVFLIVIGGILIINNTPDSNIKKLSVTVTNAGGQTETIESYTDKSYLSDALLDIGVVGDKNENGIYDTVNYTTTDEDAVWVFYKNGKNIEDIEKCLVKDGDIFEIKYEETANEN